MWKFLVSWQFSFHPRMQARDLQPSTGPSACIWQTWEEREHGGPHGPGLEVEHIISAIFYWQELSHVVPPNNKGTWEM